MAVIQAKPEKSQLTPMLQQYFDLKASCPDSVLFFRMGDFYEVFGEDAVEVSSVLNIVLTKRDKGDTSIPFCGVPHHSARSYWLKLLKQNYKIAIADQIEDPAQAKGLVKRALTKFLTPACIDDLEGLSTDKANYLMFVYEDPQSKKWLLGLTDISTGELRMGELSSLDELVKLVEIHRPKEILLRRFVLPLLQKKLESYLHQEKILFTMMPEAILRDTSSQTELVRSVVGSLENYEIPRSCIESSYTLIAALFTHLQSLKFSLKSFLKVTPLYEENRLRLNSTAICDLEIFETSRLKQAKGSLFHEINMCLSPMGTRALRWKLQHPMVKIEDIEKSQNWVESFYSQRREDLESIRSHLKKFPDMERLSVKIASRQIKPSELVSIQKSLEKIKLLLQELKSLPTLEKLKEHRKCIETLKKSNSILDVLSPILLEDANTLGRGDSVFKKAYDKELDSYVELSKNGEKKVLAYQEQLREITGINSLKIKSHKTFGLLIEVTKTHLSKVPSNFVRRQTMVNCERFLTVELQELNEQLQSAKEDSIQREQALYEKLILDLGKFVSILKNSSDALAQLDIHLSFAWLALEKKYVRPEIDPSKISLRSVRHPTVESFVGSYAFNPNDVFLSNTGKQMLITGPNMGGKSTIMRTVAICAILNQCGAFIPAQSASLPIFDQIFTRVGASDDLVKGLSTFMVEMTETADILRQATPKSLVILDEVGRGTSTEDGLAIASAVLQNLSENVQSWTFFATHYHELVDFAKAFPSIKTFQTEVITKGDTIKFTHRLIEGSSGSSYGIQVAELSGLPDSVIKQAHAFLNSSQHGTRENHPLPQIEKEKVSKEKEQILDILNQLSVNETSPVEALNILFKLKQISQKPKKQSANTYGQPLF